MFSLRFYTINPSKTSKLLVKPASCWLNRNCCQQLVGCTSNIDFEVTSNQNQLLINWNWNMNQIAVFGTPVLRAPHALRAPNATRYAIVFTCVLLSSFFLPTVLFHPLTVK